MAETAPQFTLDGDLDSPGPAAPPSDPPAPVQAPDAEPNVVLQSPSPPEEAPIEQAPSTTGSFMASALAGSATMLRNAKARAAAAAEQVSQKFARDPTRSSAGSETGGAEADAAHVSPPSSPPPPSSLSSAGTFRERAEKTAAAAAVAATAAKESAAAAASDISKRAKEMYVATAEGLKRLATPARKVTAICRSEVSAKPCPHVVLSCCTVIVTSGLRTPNIMAADVPAEAVELTLARMEAPHISLVPSNLEPTMAAAVLKQWLASLDEPLLLFRLADKWIAAGDPDADTPALLRELVHSLPPANRSTLFVIMETAFRIAAQSHATGMNAMAIAAVLAPALLWKIQPSPPLLPVSLPQAITNISALKSRLVGQPAKPAAPATCVSTAMDQCASTGPPDEADGGSQGAGAGGVGATEAPMPAEADRSGGHADEDAAHRTHADDDLEPPLRGTRLPLAGEELEAVVRVLEYCIINVEDEGLFLV